MEHQVTPQTTAAVMHDFAPQQQESFVTPKLFFILLVCMLGGIITGFFAARWQLSNQAALMTVSSSAIKVGSTYGSTDTQTFKDSSEGIIEKGGIGDEGQYHLTRPGGPAQSVALTSSTVDLSQFVNRKVKIYGETQASEKAGWLMDVGKLEVLE